MWVFTQGGFVSIVRHRTKPDMMLVRSRGRAHLENFTRGYSCVKVIHTPGADYEYRVLMGETAVKRMLANAVDDADYDNFKNCVDHGDDRVYAALLHRVWSLVQSVLETRKKSPFVWHGSYDEEEAGTLLSDGEESRGHPIPRG